MSPLGNGVFPPIPTPFDDTDSVDYDALADVIDHVESGGVNGFAPVGTTGERSTLAPAEHRDVIEFAVEEASTTVVAGTGSPSTWETIELTRHAEDVGADGALVLGPYYSRPSEDDTVEHYRAVANAVDLPIVIYNFPAGMGFNITPDVVETLAAHENIVGIKDSSGDMGQLNDLCARTADMDFDVMSGWDSLVLPATAAGAVGLVGVCANLFPGDAVRLLEAGTDGNAAAVRDLHHAMVRLEDAVLVKNPQITIKKGLEVLGVIDNPAPRAPQQPLDDEQAATVTAAIEDYLDETES
ncbi:4-hydroxy-tetrahydrodipicolinate synthase [Halomicroarcula sp. GCM10025817]|uniref:4-hydroxy-tetrahydrodipicolinate synthase n=1 Tax=Halomicroarcula sp. GCM10025817 TaxID=3252672 RepID=UPI00360CA05F